MRLLDKDQVNPLLFQHTAADTGRVRLLRRTISVPVESQFPTFQIRMPTEIEVLEVMLEFSEECNFGCRGRKLGLNPYYSGFGQEAAGHL
ncbi:DAB2 interacting protein b isoform X1 [Tachysurus ichikawai]